MFNVGDEVVVIGPTERKVKSNNRRLVIPGSQQLGKIGKVTVAPNRNGIVVVTLDEQPRRPRNFKVDNIKLNKE